MKTRWKAALCLLGLLCLTGCGAPAPEDTQFCTNCGMRLPPPPETPRPAGTPEDGGPSAP